MIELFCIIYLIIIINFFDCIIFRNLIYLIIIFFLILIY